MIVVHLISSVNFFVRPHLRPFRRKVNVTWGFIIWQFWSSNHRKRYVRVREIPRVEYNLIRNTFRTRFTWNSTNMNLRKKNSQRYQMSLRRWKLFIYVIRSPILFNYGLNTINPSPNCILNLTSNELVSLQFLRLVLSTLSSLKRPKEYDGKLRLGMNLVPDWNQRSFLFDPGKFHY